MQHFLANSHEAAKTTVGLFWMAYWAFGLGYLISSMIQVFVTRERMKKSMGEAGAASVGLGTFFGFISSSCSFAALGILPDASGTTNVTDREFVALNYTSVLNIVFIGISAAFLFWRWTTQGLPGGGGSEKLSERILFGIATLAFLWLIAGLALPPTGYVTQ